MKHILIPACAALAMVLTGPAASAKDSPKTAAVAQGPGSISGIWVNVTYQHASVYDARLGMLRTIDGQTPPLQPWALALLEKRIKDADAGHPFANTKSLCLPSGVPQLMFGPAVPIQILETRGQVTILVEEFNNFRVIPINAKHTQDPDPTFMGESIGRWQGRDFVVDTIGLTDRTVLDVPGMPHSDQLHVVERFRRVGPKRLELTVTLDDPKTFTRPWTAKAAYEMAPYNKLSEFLCENQRNIAEDGKTTMKASGAN